MAVRNANDAISQVQTEEGAMIEVDNILQRMRTLAVQSGTGTNTSTDRSALDTEFTALASELQRIGANTQWNGTDLVDGVGTAGAQSFQIGANASQTISHTFAQLETTAIASGSVAPAEGATSTSSNDADIDTVVMSGGTYVVGDTLAFTIDSIVLTAEVTSVNGSDAVNGLKFHGSSTTISHDGTSATGSDVIFTATANGGGAVTATMSAEGTMTLTGGTSGGGNYFTTGELGALSDGTSIAEGSLSRGILAGAMFADISTVQGSTQAIKTLDHVIAQVNSARATSGAAINRLEYAADNLANVSQNASASRSRILDADYAAETTELARTQIIQQAGTAMLSQANQQAQSVLSLLK
tara:strand:- start:5997 stop:7064 length:1068 start_codon:yes stop_codon:yes gene_type:complete